MRSRMISLKRTTILGDMRTERYNMCLCGNRMYLEVVSMCFFFFLHVGHLSIISVSAYNNGCCACVGTGMNSAVCRVSNCWKGFVCIYFGGRRGVAFFII